MHSVGKCQEKVEKLPQMLWSISPKGMGADGTKSGYYTGIKTRTKSYPTGRHLKRPVFWSSTSL